MRQLKTALAVIGAATVLVLAGNTISLATTGQAILLGKSNSAGTITGVARTTSGSVLNLKSASTANAPLIVNGTGKVAHFNADQVDGFDSSQLLNRALVYTAGININQATGFTMALPGVPPGDYIADVTGIFPAGPSNSVHTCALQPSDGKDLFESDPPNPAGFLSPSLAGEISLTGTDTVTFGCSDKDLTVQNWGGASSTYRIQVTFTPISSVITATATPTANP